MKPVFLALCATLAASALPPPAGAQAPSLRLLAEGPVVLGETGSVALELRVGDDAQADERPLRLAVNVGTFGEMTRVGPGLYRVLYVPPTTRFPQVALIAVWRETGPDAPIDFLRLPLHGRTRLPLGAAKGAELRVTVGKKEFGPVVVSDRERKAEIPIVVPPGIREATVTAKSATGATSTRTVAISIPPYNRLTAALTPHAISADARGWARLEVYYDGEGEPPSPNDVQVVPSVGTVSLMRVERGRYAYRYVPPPASTAEAVDFKVSLARDAAARAQARLKLRLPPPSRLVVRAPPEVLPCDGRSATTVVVYALDDTGLGLPGLPLDLTADGKALPVRDVGNGRYEAAFTAPDRYPPGGLVRFEAGTPVPGNQPLRAFANYQLKPTALAASVSVRIAPDPVPADGRTAARLTLLVRDSAGMPVSNQHLFAVASEGTLGELEDVGGGQYVARYTPPAGLPDGEATVRVMDATGSFEQRTPIPLRESPGRLLLGLRGGFFHNLDQQYGPRGGLDAWVPLRLGSFVLGMGLSATYGQAHQKIADGELSSESRARFIPIALRLGAEAYASRRFSVTIGGGGLLVYSHLSTTLTAEEAQAWGGGALGFLSFGYALGPGQLFVDLTGAWAPLTTSDFTLDAGGAGVEFGYRLGVF